MIDDNDVNNNDDDSIDKLLKQSPSSNRRIKLKTTTTTATTTIKNLSSTECTIFLGLLYFIQGFPYGFQDKLIPLLLIIKGHSPSTIGFIRLLLLPWLTKALFAPLIDMVYYYYYQPFFSLLFVCFVTPFPLIYKLLNS